VTQLFDLNARIQQFLLYFFSWPLRQGFQSGPVPGTFTCLRSCIVPAEITEPPKLAVVKTTNTMITSIAEFSHLNRTTASRPSWWDIPCFKNNFTLATSLSAVVLVVLTPANFGGFSNFCRYYTRSQAGKSTGPLWNPWMFHVLQVLAPTKRMYTFTYRIFDYK
jgi:hypothetical protein